MTRGLQAASSDDPQFAGCERPSRAAALLTCGCRPIRVGPSSRRYVRYRRRALAESKFDPRGFGPRLAPCLRPGALSRSPKVIPSRTPSASVRTILIPGLSVPLSSRAVPPPPRGLTSLLYVGSVPSYTWAEPPLYVGRAPPLYVGGAPSIRGRSPLYTRAEPPLYVGGAPLYVGGAPSVRGRGPASAWATPCSRAGPPRFAAGAPLLLRGLSQPPLVVGRAHFRQGRAPHSARRVGRTRRYCWILGPRRARLVCALAAAVAQGAVWR